MSRDEFMRELEYLLSDISEDEKADAIEYYRDYLEEAGEEHEEEVIKSFGSPERIASIIRSDIFGDLEDGGDFTEKGYEDKRFKDPNYQMAKRYELPEVSDYQTEYENESFGGPGKEGISPERNRTVRLILWIVLIIVASPALLGIGGGIIGLVSGFFGILLAAVVGVGAATFALLLAGAAMIVAGIVAMVLRPLSGVLLLGLGILFLGIGLLALAFCGVFYGRFLPFLFRSGTDAISRLFYRRRGRL